MPQPWGTLQQPSIHKTALVTGVCSLKDAHFLSIDMDHIMSKKINVKSAEPKKRYLQTDEEIYDYLTPNEFSVYYALRLECDFAKECDGVDLTISALAKKSKVSSRTVNTVLNKLEKDAHLIKRTNWDNMKYGQKNEYLVARTLFYFKQKEQKTNTNATIALPVQELTTNATIALPNATIAQGVRNHCVPYIESQLLHNSFTTTTTGQPSIEPQKSVSQPVVVVVLNSQKITTQLLAAFRDNPVETDKIKTEEDFLSACEYSILHRNDGNKGDTYSEMQRVRALIKFVKSGSFDNPKGWRNKQKESHEKINNKEIEKPKPFTDDEMKIMHDYRHAKSFNNERMLKSFFDSDDKLQTAIRLVNAYDEWVKS